MKTDLHIHSTFSDGALSPAETVRLAADRGLEQVSVVDHDNLHAYDELAKAPAPEGIRLVTGVEMDAHLIHLKLGVRSVEIIGYGFDPLHPGLRERLEAGLRERRERGRAIMLYLNEKLGRTVWPEVLMTPDATVMIPDVLRAYVKRRLIADIAEGKRLLREAPGLPAVHKMPSDEAIALIHDAGGKAVLAHPARTDLADLDEARTALAWLRGQGLDGFEAHYPYERSAGNNLAKFDPSPLGEDWPEALRTGGSDAHSAKQIGGYYYDAPEWGEGVL